MKTIGLIGGLSWESTAEYYRLANERVRERLGGLHSAEMLLRSVDFAEVEACQRDGRWDDATTIMVGAARQLERGGADMMLIASNTMHRMADDVQAAVDMPLLHIADATAAVIKQLGVSRVGLLATVYTMEQDFYVGRLEHRHGLDVLTPDAAGRQSINRVIYDELCLGRVLPESRKLARSLIDGLVAQGAQAVVLGCTELGLLIAPQDAAVPVLDTARIHVEAAVDAALEPIAL